MLADYHVHSEFSFDSVYKMEDIINDAISLGLNEICFTEHIDYGVCIEYDEPIEKALVHKDITFVNVNYPKYFEKLKECQEKYRDKITIKKGLEYGAQIHTLDKYEKLYKTYPLDFIILSIHEINDQDIAFKEYWQNKSQIQSHRQYYENYLKIVQQYKHYSVLGHLDYPQRYDPNGKCPLSAFEDIVVEILKQVIKDGKGIEVNMGCVRYKINDLTPCKDILKIYKDLGGKIITIGTDSHKPEHLGKHIEYAKQELKELGFTQFCTYDNMQPIFHNL